MKITIVNSKTKQKPKTILGRMRNLVLDFILYFVTEKVLYKYYTIYILYEKVPHTCNMSTG